MMAYVIRALGGLDRPEPLFQLIMWLRMRA